VPVTSKAQWKKFHAMYERGEISKATLDHWIKGVDYDSLPAKAKKKRVDGRSVVKGIKEAGRSSRKKS
jgi:hypothetical protein